MIFESLIPSYYNNNCLDNWDSNEKHITITIYSPPYQVRPKGWVEGGYKQSKMLSGCQGLGIVVGVGWGGGNREQILWEFSVVTEEFCISIAVVVTWLYPCDKMTWNYIHILYKCRITGSDISYNYVRCNQTGNWWRL